MEEWIVRLQTRVAHQDHTIEELNSVVTGQQQQIEQLREQVREIIEVMKAGVPFGGELPKEPPYSPY